MLNNLYSKLASCNCDFSKFWCGLGEEFPTLSKRALKLLYLFKIVMCVRQGSQWWPWKQNKTKHGSRIVPMDDRRASLSTTVPRISDIVRRKQAQKSHWLFKIVSHFQKTKNLNMAVYSFFQTFCPLIQWYAGSYEIVFRISLISANHFLNVFIFACKSILLKFHLRDR